MNICVFGAGAIGGYIGCSLSKAGANVSLIARGPHKEAIEENGLTLITGNRSENFKSYDNYEGYSNFFSDRWNTLRLEFSVSSNDNLLSEYNNICNEINRIAKKL